MNSNQTIVLLELLRAAVLDRDPSLSEGAVVDWNELMDLADRQGVLAWVFDSVCRLPKEMQPPRQQRINWGLSAQVIWDDYEKHLRILDQLLAKCRENNMRLLLLKGIGLSTLYPQPHSRPCGDIDIYLFDDYQKGNSIFGVRPIEEEGKHSTLVLEGVIIENHNGFFEPNTRQKRKLISHLEESLPEAFMCADGYYKLSPQADLLFLTFHTLKHFYEFPHIPIRNVVDFAMFLMRNQRQLPPENCLLQLREMSLVRSFAFLLFLSEEILQVDFEAYHFYSLPEEDRASLKQALLEDAQLSDGLINKYIPRNTPFKSDVDAFFVRNLKRMLSIPQDVSIKEWLHRSANAPNDRRSD